LQLIKIPPFIIAFAALPSTLGNIYVFLKRTYNKTVTNKNSP